MATQQGTTGDDTLYGGADHDVLHGDAGNDRLIGGAGDDTLYGNADNDVLHGDAGHDWLQGGPGDDTLDGGLGDDSLIGGAGNDIFLVNRAAGHDVIGDATSEDTLLLGEGIAVTDLQGSFNGDDLVMRIGADQSVTLYGWLSMRNRMNVATLRDGVRIELSDLGNGRMSLTGTAGDDRIIGTAGKDQIRGGDGDDILIGGSGSDSLSGDAGDDTLTGGTGNDVFAVFRGEGHDVITDATSTDELWLGGLWNESDMAELRASRSADDLVLRIGPDQSVTLRDWRTMPNRLEVVTIQEGRQLNLTDLADGQFVLIGTAHNDRLYGTPGNDTLDGADGNDTLYGRAGDDFLEGGPGDDTLEGEAGNDTLSGGAGRDWLEGGDGDDMLLGGEGNDVLDGGEGNNTLLGGAGDDHLSGGDAGDTLDGGDGHDWLFGGDGDDMLIGGDGNDNLAAYKGDDSLDGGAGDDDLWGHEGNDALDGGEGNDTLRGGEGDDTLTGGDGKDIFEISYGDEGHDVITDATSADELELSGHAGGFITATDLKVDFSADDMVLRTGVNQTVTLRGWKTMPNRLEVVSLRRLSGAQVNLTDLADGRLTLIGTKYGDKLAGTAGHDSLLGGAGNDSLQGEAGHDTLRGGDDDDTLLGGDGNDLLSGDAGNDSMAGGTGNDTLEGGDGDDFLAGGVVLDLDTLAQGTESGDNTLSGGDGNDKLLGGFGNDALSGGAGNDTLYGHLGDDTLTGGEGDDTFEIVNNGAGHDVITDATSADMARLSAVTPAALRATLKGDDLVLNIGSNQTLTLKNWQTTPDRLAVATLQHGERVSLSDLVNGRMVITGTDGDDHALIGTAGRDSLHGQAGHDTLYTGAGDDTLYGDAGDDALYGGADNDVLFGGEGNDILFGETGNDSLYGDSGDDTLEGGVGNDTLEGGAGRDVYRIVKADGHDVIADATTEDVLVLNHTMTDLVEQQTSVRLNGDDLVVRIGPNKSVTLSQWRIRQDRLTHITLGGPDGERVELRAYLSALDAGRIPTGEAGPLSAANFRASASGLAGNADDSVVYNTTTGALPYGTDGNGSGVAGQFATLDNKPGDVTAGDFLFTA